MLVSTFNKKCHIRKCAAIHILFTKIHLPSHSTKMQGHSCVNPEKEYPPCPHLHIMFEKSGKPIRSHFYSNVTLLVAVTISSEETSLYRHHDINKRLPMDNNLSQGFLTCITLCLYISSIMYDLFGGFKLFKA